MVIPFSIDAIVNTAEIVGGIAVIASLLFVARQMRENNKSARESNYIQVMQHNKDMGRLIGSDVKMANLYRRGCDDFMGLPPDERWQFGSLMMAMFCDFNQQHTLYNQDRLDQQFWNAIEHNMQFYLDRKGVGEWWRSQPFEFDLSFVEYVDAYIDSRKGDKSVEATAEVKSSAD
ncbi:MAG: hypothetical protein ACJAY7_001109 [Pseudohongiellaceae bacterium]|jgi:hypothetical protein